jgi:site-specific DNA-cytosine methylase
MAGFRELLAVEWDKHAVETFRLNFPGVPVWQGDIADLSVEECLRIAGIEPGQLDVFDGSPPCQGFSTAGRRRMEDGRNQLFREYVRLLRGLRPKVLVMENVSGMVKRQDEADLCGDPPRPEGPRLHGLGQTDECDVLRGPPVARADDLHRCAGGHLGFQRGSRMCLTIQGVICRSMIRTK